MFRPTIFVRDLEQLMGMIDLSGEATSRARVQGAGSDAAVTTSLGVAMLEDDVRRAAHFVAP